MGPLWDAVRLVYTGERDGWHEVGRGQPPRPPPPLHRRLRGDEQEVDVARGDGSDDALPLGAREVRVQTRSTHTRGQASHLQDG